MGQQKECLRERARTKVVRLLHSFQKLQEALTLHERYPGL